MNKLFTFLTLLLLAGHLLCFGSSTLPEKCYLEDAIVGNEDAELKQVEPGVFEEDIVLDYYHDLCFNILTCDNNNANEERWYMKNQSFLNVWNEPVSVQLYKADDTSAIYQRCCVCNRRSGSWKIRFDYNTKQVTITSLDPINPPTPDTMLVKCSGHDEFRVEGNWDRTRPIVYTFDFSTDEWLGKLEYIKIGNRSLGSSELKNVYFINQTSIISSDILFGNEPLTMDVVLSCDGTYRLDVKTPAPTPQNFSLKYRSDDINKITSESTTMPTKIKSITVKNYDNPVKTLEKDTETYYSGEIKVISDITPSLTFSVEHEGDYGIINYGVSPSMTNNSIWNSTRGFRLIPLNGETFKGVPLTFDNWASTDLEFGCYVYDEYLYVYAPGQSSFPCDHVYLIGQCQGWNINDGSWVLTKENATSPVCTGTFFIPAGEAMFRFYTALGDWESNSYGYMVDDVNTDFYFYDNMGLNLISGKGNINIVDWQGGYLKISAYINSLPDGLYIELEGVDNGVEGIVDDTPLLISIEGDYAVAADQTADIVAYTVDGKCIAQNKGYIDLSNISGAIILRASGKNGVATRKVVR